MDTFRSSQKCTMKATRLYTNASNAAIFTYELCAHDRERLTEHGNDGQFCALQTAIANTIPRSTLLRKTTFLARSTLQRSVASASGSARLAIALIRRRYMPSFFLPVSLRRNSEILPRLKNILLL